MDPADEYKSPFNFEQGVNTSYLYLSTKENFTPPSSPALLRRGIPKSDVPEVGEDAVTTVEQTASSIALTEEEQQELRNELAKLEEEIQTLSQVLASKEKQVADIKRKLGITPLNELKQNLSKSWQEVTTSTAYRRTSETLSQAGQKATAAFSSVGSAISRKLDDARNTSVFKSFEEKVENLKTKMSSTPSSNELGDVSNSTPNAEPVVEQPEGTNVQAPETHCGTATDQ